MSKFLTPAKLIAEYGAFYRAGTVNAQDLFDQIMTKSDIKELFNVRSTENTRIDNINKQLSSVLQPFYNRFSPNGTLDFVPNPWNLDRVKINVEMEPDDLAATALDFYSQKGVSRKDAPVVQTIAQYLIDKAREDDEIYSAFKGIKGTPTAQEITDRTALGPEEARDGIRTKIRAYNTAGKTNAIASGAVPTDPALFVEYIEDFYYSIPEEMRGYIKWISVSDTLLTRFKRGMRIKYDVNYEQTKGMRSMIIDTDCEIKGFHAQRGSDMIWTSFPLNCQGRIKQPSNKQVFDLDTKEIYQVMMATDWYEGYDFINPDWIWHNAQDLGV